MKALILSSALALVSGAFAGDAMILRAGKDVVRLWNSPCEHAETLAQIIPEFRAKFRKAHSVIDGKDQFACWIVTPKGMVHLVWEDGDEAELPVSAFIRDEGV